MTPALHAEARRQHQRPPRPRAPSPHPRPPGHHAPGPARRPPLEPQAQRTSASGRAHRARPAVSGMLGARTASVKRQMTRPDQHERRLAAQARRRPPRPESIRARRRGTRVGWGRGSARRKPSPGARGASGSPRDRAASRSAAAGPRNAGTLCYQPSLGRRGDRRGAWRPAGPRPSTGLMSQAPAPLRTPMRPAPTPHTVSVDYPPAGRGREEDRQGGERPVAP